MNNSSKIWLDALSFHDGNYLRLCCILLDQENILHHYYIWEEMQNVVLYLKFYLCYLSIIKSQNGVLLWLKKIEIAGSMMGRLRNECNCFNWPKSDVQRLSEHDYPSWLKMDYGPCLMANQSVRCKTAMKTYFRYHNDFHGSISISFFSKP